MYTVRRTDYCNDAVCMQLLATQEVDTQGEYLDPDDLEVRARTMTLHFRVSIILKTNVSSKNDWFLLVAFLALFLLHG